MEDFNNLDRSKDTSEYSSDESVYFSASDSLDLPPYEEFDNHSYLSESDNSSIYSGIYEPVIGQVNPTIFPATANYIGVLGIFPVEVSVTAFYQQLFYYVPVQNNVYYTNSPDFGQEVYETESAEYSSTNSYTDISSSSSDTYYTAEESQSYFDEHVETNVETTSVEFSPNEDFDLSKSNEYVASESSKGYEKEGCDNAEFQNEIEYTSSDDEYDYEADELGYFNEINVETTSLEFYPNDDFDLRKGNEYVASESSKGYEEEGCDNAEFQNEIKYTSSDDEYDYEAEELGYFNEINVETTSLEFSPNEDFDLSKSNEYVASESSKGYEEEGCDNAEFQNEIKCTSSDDEYDYEAEELGYFNEIKVETTSLEFSPNDDFDLLKGNEYVASESSKGNEEEGCDNVELQNEITYTSADNIKNNKVETDRLFYVGDSNNRSDSSEKSSINAFEFESINYKDCQNEGLKKHKSFDDLSGKTQRQPLKKRDDYKNLSTVEDDEVHEKDFQRNDTEIRVVNHEQNEKKPKKKKMKRLREFMARIFCCVKPP